MSTVEIVDIANTSFRNREAKADAESLNLAGIRLSHAGRHREALAFYNRAIDICPDLAVAYYNKGNALDELGQIESAISAYSDAVRADQNYGRALFNWGIMLEKQGDLEKAFSLYIRASRVGFDDAELTRRFHNALSKLGPTLSQRAKVCNWNDFDDISYCHPWYLSQKCTSAARMRESAEQYTAETYPASAGKIIQHRQKNEYARGRLRIAFLAESFRTHPVTQLLVNLIECLDRDRFECFGISLHPSLPNDPWRDRIERAFEHFLDIDERSDTEIAEILRAHAIDIAIDLDGHTVEGRSLAIAQHRVAPVQVSWLGYPGTTGAPFIDYILADPFIIPSGQEHHYSENVIRLPNSYQPNDRNRSIVQVPARSICGLPEDQFVFCSLNNSYKITPAMFDIWMSILHRVDRSVLWLLYESDVQIANLRNEASMRGIGPERLIFAPRTAVDEHIARHAAADLYIDTFPYNAHTSAAEALWAGLPLVTLAGETFPSRVAGSLLSAIGLPELITTTPNAYEELVVELATEPDRLARLRAKLAANRLTTPLFDTEGFARDFENVLVALYHHHSASQMEET